ncbi:MAG: hypothetical protein C4526_10155 [Nitrospiraceae bacterium]|nr:MAG: hypothetical protein C4526_10155 [Nitrospiraceae bacterium]
MMNFRAILKLVILTAVLGCLYASAGHAESRVDIGATITDEGLRGFYLSVGDYYRVPEREVVIIRDRGVPYYESPVVFYIASLAHVAPGVVIDLRLSGRSWMDITLHFGLSPEIYYVPVKIVPGPPYGRAYGYFKKRPRKEWRKIVLSDDDVINLVNLRFTSEYYGYQPEDVIHMRSGGKDFVGIHDNIRKEKKGRGREREHGKFDDDKGQGRGKGHK